MNIETFLTYMGTLQKKRMEQNPLMQMLEMLRPFHTGTNMVNVKNQLFFYKLKGNDEWLYIAGVGSIQSTDIQLLLFIDSYGYDTLEAVSSSVSPLVYKSVRMHDFAKNAIDAIISQGELYNSHIWKITTVEQLFTLLQDIDVELLHRRKFGV